MAEQFGARLSLLYVTETVPTPAEFGYPLVDTEAAANASAQEALEEIARRNQPDQAEADSLARTATFRATILGN